MWLGISFTFITDSFTNQKKKKTGLDKQGQDQKQKICHFVAYGMWYTVSKCQESQLYLINLINIL